MSEPQLLAFTALVSFVLAALSWRRGYLDCLEDKGRNEGWGGIPADKDKPPKEQRE